MKQDKRILLVVLIVSLVLSYINVFATSDTLTMPEALKIIGERAYYGDTSISRVVLPDGIKEIRARAFANSSLSDINLPDSLTFIDQSAFDGPNNVSVTANEGTYAYNWAVENGYIELITPKLSVKRITCSAGSSAQIGNEVFWNVEIMDSVGDVCVSYELYKDGVLIDTKGYSLSKYYRFTPQTTGSYVLKVYCKDEAGTEVIQDSSAVIVEAPALCINKINVTSDRIIVGEEACISVEAQGGNGALHYVYTTYIGGEIVSTEESNSSNRTVTATRSGRMTVEVTVIDSKGTTVKGNASVITVFSNDEARPTAPQLLFDDANTPFSTNEAESPTYVADRIDLKWEAVELATNYSLSLELKNGSMWTSILSDTTNQCAYSIAASLFDGITEETMFRLGISSTNIYSGDVQYYYFKVGPYITDTAVTIDEKTTVVWNQSSGNSSMRFFVVSSQLPWTATTEADWLSLMQESNSLRVSMTENTGVFLTRTADVVVSNGIQNAQIHVSQSNDGRWFINYPKLSQDASAPTSIATGGCGFELDHTGATPNYAAIVVYEYDNGTYIERYRGMTDDLYAYIGSQADDFSFAAGKTYRISVMAVYDANYQTDEIEEDLLKNEYYVTAEADKAYVLVDGNNVASLQMNVDEVGCYIQASGMVTYSTDVDWLQLPVETSFNKKLWVYASELNMTSTARTGHLYLSSGTATATITITQQSVEPRLIFPANISQDESNPTSLLYDRINFTAIGSEIMWYQKSGDSYTPLDASLCTSSPAGEMNSYLEKSEVAANTVYRITVRNGEVEKNYYVSLKYTTATMGVTLDGENQPVFIEAPPYSYTQVVKIKGGSSWKASSDSAWLTISKTSGNMLQVTAEVNATANTTGEVRTGTITITGGTNNLGFYPVNYIRVTQAADSTTGDFVTLCVDNRLLEDADTTMLSGEGGTIKLKIFASAPVTTTLAGKWVSCNDRKRFFPGESYDFKYEENDTGAVRYLSYPFKCGSVTKTIEFSQAPKLESPAFTNDNLSDKSDVMLDCSQGPLELTWNRVDGAAEYDVLLVAPGTGNTHRVYSEEDGSDTYTFTCPLEWLDIDSAERHYVRMHAYDAGGHSYRSKTYYFYPQSGDGVLVGKQIAPIWDRVTDYAVSSTWNILSTGEWTASSDSSWISVSPVSGNSGEAITVQLAQNTGAARTGHVTVSCGDHSAVLTVNQCAVIPKFPTLSGNTYSDDPDAPTLLPSDTNQILASWQVEPQAGYYYLELWEYDQRKAVDYRRVARSKYLKDGEDSYVFSDLELVEGQLYKLQFFRTNNGKCTATAYYFMLDSGTSHVLIDGKTIATDEEEADGGSAHVLIDSSGVWSAISDSDWITVGSDRSYSPKAIAELEDTLEEHLRCIGSGNRLHIYVFPNEQDETRTGTITVRSGSAEATLTIRQLRPYTYAELISPALGTSSSECTEVCFGDIALSWSAAEGGTGKYEVGVQESDNGRDSYETVYRKEGLTSTSHVIPKEKFTEGKYYRVYIGTEVEGGEGYYHTTTYYFHMGRADELALSPTFDWQYAAIGGRVAIRASATGGAGSYKYAYELLRNGQQESITAWMRDTYYTFNIDESGEYQVRVYVQDDDGTQKSALSGQRNIENDTEPETPLDPIEPTEERYSLKGSVVTRAGVGIDGVIVYIVDSQNDNRLLGSAMTDTSGIWYVDDLPACSSAYINFYSSDYAIENNGCRVSITSSRVLSPFYATLASTVYEESSIAFSAPANGSTVPYNEPLNLSWNAVDGASKYLYSARWTDQDDAFIFRQDTTANSATIAVSQMRSGQTLQLWVAAFDSEDNQLCQQIIRVNTSAASGETPAHSLEPVDVSGYFTMKRDGNEVTQVKTGEEVEFVVDVPGCSTVQIVVDGKGYESYSVTEDRAVFTRSFSNAGTRTIQFRPHTLYGYSDLTEAKTLTVTSIGKLSAPVIQQINTQLIGQDVDDDDLSWDAVPNATSYTVYLYHNDMQRWPDDNNPWESRTENTSITIPGDCLADEGIYTVKVVATGVNYDSSIATANFTVRPTDQAVEITYPNNTSVYNIGDTMHTRVACLQRNMNTRLRVVDRDGYPKDYDPGSDGVFYPVAEKPGTYKFTAFASTKSAFTYEGREATSATVTVTVNGPTIEALKDRWDNDYAVAFTNSTTWIKVFTNCTGTVEVFIDNESKGLIEPTIENGLEYQKTVGNLPDGAHSISLVAHYGNYYSQPATIMLYSITREDNPYTRYASRAMKLETFPGSGEGVDLVFDQQVSVEGSYGGGAYAYLKVGNEYGFVRSDLLNKQSYAQTAKELDLRITKPTSDCDYIASGHNISFGCTLNLEKFLDNYYIETGIKEMPGISKYTKSTLNNRNREYPSTSSGFTQGKYTFFVRIREANTNSVEPTPEQMVSTDRIVAEVTKEIMIYKDYSSYIAYNNPSQLDLAFSESSRYRKQAIFEESMQLAYDVYNKSDIQKRLLELHFTIRSYQNENCATGNNTVGFIYGEKTIIVNEEEKKLIVVAIRGTPDNPNEWVSNFNIGEEGDARGFYLASANVAEYLNALPIDPSSSKIWFVGHSRGAAVANYLAATWARNVGFDINDIYAYTFACPNVVKNASSYNPGIRNYNFGGDAVPRVPFSGEQSWGFERFGTTTEINNPALNNIKQMADESLTDSLIDILSKVDRRYYNRQIYPQVKRIYMEEGAGKYAAFAKALWYICNCLCNDDRYRDVGRELFDWIIDKADITLYGIADDINGMVTVKFNFESGITVQVKQSEVINRLSKLASSMINAHLQGNYLYAVQNEYLRP